MPDELTVAAVQMVSGSDILANLEQAEALLKHAVTQGAQLLVLPENFAILDGSGLYHAATEEAHHPRIQRWMQQMARQYGIWLVGGTVPLTQRPDGSTTTGKRVRAACCVFDAQGERVARYDKIHLFDVQVGDEQGTYMESSRIEPGDSIVTIPTPWGRLGLAICYDLRFAELFLALARKNVDLIALPAAFTYRTGQAHWEALIRARAIETQSIVIASNQGGRHSASRQTWGHSMVVDAWGCVKNQMMFGPGVVVSTVDLGELREIRKRMPVARHRVLS